MSSEKLQLNVYGRELTPEEISQKAHRALVGAKWDLVGPLQFEFLKEQGLLPSHHLLDVGCGCMRGGVHFVRYLNPGHYHGIDLNQSLVEAGRIELQEAGVADRGADLLVNRDFEFGLFQQRFDFAIAQSVFTHLPMNHILRCLVETAKVLTPDGIFYATFFEAPTSVHLAAYTHEPSGAVTFYDRDPYHYSFSEFEWMAQAAGLHVRLYGGWNHPKDQQMLAFSLPRSG